jgi:hypothetical protein
MSPPVTPQIHVDVGGAAELEFRLIVAGAREKVRVSGAPTLVETNPSAVSTLFDGRALNHIQLDGRRVRERNSGSRGWNWIERNVRRVGGIRQ